MKQFKLFSMFTLLAAVFGLAACGGQAATASAPSTNVAEVIAETAVAPTTQTEIVPTSDSGTEFNCDGGGEIVEIADARLYVEFNSTDEDLGVHGAFDDSGWSELCVYDPDGEQILGIKPQSQLADLTMASIFFESREPELGEFSFDNLSGNFPEGQYTVRALSYDGTVLTGAATFTHDVPAPPVIITPPLANDEESAADILVSPTDLVVSWEEVIETVNGDPLTTSGYEVIITKVAHDDPHGYSRPVYDVHVAADRSSLAVPIEFLEPETIYELEVLALEVSGNQTISVGFFQTN